jgi:hypothetical protein
VVTTDLAPSPGAGAVTTDPGTSPDTDHGMFEKDRFNKDDKEEPEPGPYPPSKRCGGITGKLQVDRFIVRVGEAVVFSACGFVPGATVTIAVNGTDVETVIADSNGNIVGQVTLHTLGKNTITGTGEGVQKLGLFGQVDTSLPIVTPLADPMTGNMDENEGTASITRVVSATVDVVDGTGIGIDGTGFIPIPIPIPIPIGGIGNGNGCFNNGILGNNDKNGKDDKDRNGNCVAVGVVGGGFGGGAGGPGGPGGATPAGSALPFTGIETGAMASIALALLGGGLLLRVAARRRRNTLGAHTES